MIRLLFSLFLTGVLLFSTSFTLFWKKYKDYNYTIYHSRSWSIDKSGKLATKFIFTSSLDSSEDIFQENVNLIIQDVSELDLSLNKFVEITIQQIKTMLPNGKLLVNECVRRGGPEFQRLIYTSAMNKRNMKFEQYCWVVKQEAFILTFTCEESEYDNCRKTGQKILNSFVFNKKEL